MEDALGHTRKYIDHGIDTLLLRHIRKTHNICAVRKEFAVEETIHQIHLYDDVEEAQHLAGPVAYGVQFVALHEERERERE